MRNLLMIIGYCTMMLSIGCSSHAEEKSEPVKFLVTSPLKKDTSIIKEYVCQIHAIQHIELRALERGYLQNIYVDEGQFVKKGQLMFKIMPLIYNAELKRAQAEADFAEIEYKNTKQLADSNVVSPNELALAKAKFDKANAELSLAQVHLGFTEIRAPFDGYMDRFRVRLGSLLDEGDLLTTLSDNSDMWVYFNMPEAEYLDFKSNINPDSLVQVGLLMANNKQFAHIGAIETIEADFNNETGNIAFRATFPNPEKLLRHGETGSVLMTIPLEQAMLIPQKTTFEVLDKNYVFVVDAENKLQQREVKVGTEMPDLFAITSGLNEGDKILLEGLRKVQNGEEIEYEFREPSKVISELKLYAE